MQEATSYSLGIRKYPTYESMDPVRSLMLRRMDELGIKPKQLSARIGRNHAYIQQFLKRGVPQNLPESVRTVVAGILGVDEDDLRGARLRSERAKTIPENARLGGNVVLARKIPAFGHARGGRDGQFVLNGNKVADLLAPPSLASVPDAYAVYVAGTSMEPRYFAGEAVYVNPRLPVRRGDFVVAQIRATEGEPPLAYVKRFVGLDTKTLKLEQLNPKKALVFPANAVVSVHRIVMGGDG